MSLRLAQAIRNRLLRIDSSEVRLQKRGFAPTRLQDHIETIGESFLFGYHLALERKPCLMGGALEALCPSFRGFAYEGAGMALGLCDRLSLSKQTHWQDLLRGVGNTHRYVLHVGLGWAYARIPWCRRNPEKYAAGLDPLLKWLVLDGLGFHEGYFYWKQRSAEKACPLPLSEYGKRVFDQGLGRCLWFVSGGSTAIIAQKIESLPRSRQADYWSGIGLAMAYAGVVTIDDIDHLLDKSGNARAHIAQGVAFGAEARNLAGIANANTDLVCNCVWGLPTSQVAALTYASLPQGGDSTDDCVLYEKWRTNIRESLKCHAQT